MIEAIRTYLHNVVHDSVLPIKRSLRHLHGSACMCYNFTVIAGGCITGQIKLLIFTLIFTGSLSDI